MRMKSKIIFHKDPKETEKLLSSLNISAKVDFKDTMQVIRLFTDIENYKKLIDALTANEIDFHEQQEEVYSQNDLDTSELFRIIANVYCGYPQPEDDYQEISYDFQSKCLKCSNGMLQKEPLHMLKPQMGSNDIAGIHWIYEFVISDKLKDLIEKEKLTGFEIWPIIEAKKKTPLVGLNQIFINGQMPLMSPDTNIIRAPQIPLCDCGKKGYMLKDIPVYDRKSLKSIKDFNKTYEWLGGLAITSQLAIVSKGVYDLFIKHKIKGVRFEPVKIVN